MPNWVDVGTPTATASPITDDLLDGVRQAESNGDPNAVSPAGAKGAYQFTDDTAKRFGINPFDEDQSRDAARQYLEQMHGQFGDTDLALAGYNWGPNHVAKLLKAGFTKDEILAQAPKETQDYVKKVNSNAADNSKWQDVGSGQNEPKWQDIDTSHPMLLGAANKVMGFANAIGAGDEAKEGMELGKALGSHPLRTLGGIAMSGADLVNQGLTAAGDVMLRGMPGPPGLAAKVMRPDLKPGASGIMEDVNKNTQASNNLLSPDVVNDPSFQTGRKMLGLPFQLAGVNDAVSKIPNNELQSAINVGMAASGPFLMGEGGEAIARKFGKGKVAADIGEDPNKTSSQNALDKMGINNKFTPPNSDDPIYVDSNGQAMRSGDLDAAQAARAQMAKAAFDADKANYEPPVRYDGGVDYAADSIVRNDDPTSVPIPRQVIKSGERSSGEPNNKQNYDYEGGVPFDTDPNYAGRKSYRNPDGTVNQRLLNQNLDPTSLAMQLDNLRERAAQGASPEALKASLEGDSGNLFDDPNVAEVQKQGDTNAAYRQQAANDRVAAANEPRPPVQDRANEPLQEPSQNSPTVEKMQPPINDRSGAKIMGRKQRGSGDMFNDLARGIFKIGDMIKDATGNLVRVIGEDANGYRIKTDVDGGAIYSTVRKSDRILRPADDVRLSDGRTGTVRAVAGDNVKVSIKRGEGFDLETVPKSSVDLMDRSTRALGQTSFGKGQRGSIDLNAMFGKESREELLKKMGFEFKGIPQPEYDNAPYYDTYFNGKKVDEHETLEAAQKSALESYDHFKSRESTQNFLSDMEDKASKRNPFKGPGKNQAGAISFRKLNKGADPGIDPIETEKAKVSYDPDTLIDELFKHWNRSIDVDDFRGHIERESNINSSFDDKILNNVPDIYDKFDQGFRPKSQISRLSKLMQRDTADMRPYEQMLDETIIGNDKDGQPIYLKDLKGALDGEQHDISSWKKEFLAPQFIASMDWDRMGSRLVKWAYSNAADIRQEAGIALKELMDHKKHFNELPRKSQLNVMEHAWGWDANELWNKELLDKGIQWPTMDMLKEKGLNDIEANAYLRMADAYDKAYKMAGIDATRLPGYFHHAFSGAFKVYIKTPEAGLIRIKPFITRQAAERAVQLAIKEGATDSHLVKPTISQRNSFVNEAIKMVGALQNRGKAGAAAAQILLRLEEKMVQGTITEALERKGIAGWDFEAGVKGENVLDGGIFMNRMYNTRMMKVFDQVMQDAVRAYKNRQIIDTIARPFFGDMKKYDKMPNTVQAVKDIVNKATGFSAQEYGGLDKFLRLSMIKFGVSPAIPSNVLGFLNAGIRFAKTNSLNPIFAAKHFLFQGYGMEDLLRIHMEHKAAGEPYGDFAGSVEKWMNSALPMDVLLNDDEKAAIAWFKNKGGFKTNYYDLPEFRGKVGAVGNALSHGLLDLVINKSKKMTFTMGYSYFKSIPGMSTKAALDAAWNHTSKTMQSFDVLDRPEIFQEGVIGKAIGPFNQIHTYNLARRLQALQAISSAATGPKPYYVPMMVGVAASMILMDNLFGGVQAIPFHNDWEKVRYILSKTTHIDPDYLRSFEQWSAQAGLPDWFIFGKFPTLLNSDIRGTFSTNFLDPFNAAGLGAGVELGALAIHKAMKAYTGAGDPNIDYRLESELAPSGMWGDPRPGGMGIGRPWIQDEAAKHLGGLQPEPLSLIPTSPRTPAEDLQYKITGSKAMSESMRNEKVKMAEAMSKQDEVWGKMRTDLIINKMAGFNTGSKSVQDLMSDATLADHGWNPEKFDSALAQKLLLEKITPAAIKFVEKAAASKDDLVMAERFRHILEVVRGSDNKNFGQ